MPAPKVRPDAARFPACLDGPPGPRTHELDPAAARAQAAGPVA